MYCLPRARALDVSLLSPNHKVALNPKGLAELAGPLWSARLSTTSQRNLHSIAFVLAQDWLKHTNGGLWSSPASFYNEEYPTYLEVLSELSLDPPYPPPPLPPKMFGAPALQHAEEDVDLALRKMPPNHWLMENLRVQNQRPLPCSQSSPLESQNTYVTLTGNNHGQVARTHGAPLPIEALLALKKTMLSEVH